MSQPSKRSRQIADLIHTQIALLLKKEVNDPRLHQLSITMVRVSPDLANADIYFVLPDVIELSQVKQALTKAKGYLRHRLAERVELRYVPKLNFLYDKALDEGCKISGLIEQALAEDDRIKKQSEANDDDREKNKT